MRCQKLFRLLIEALMDTEITSVQKTITKLDWMIIGKNLQIFRGNSDKSTKLAPFLTSLVTL